jgi:hypothetical protein
MEERGVEERTLRGRVGPCRVRYRDFADQLEMLVDEYESRSRINNAKC